MIESVLSVHLSILSIFPYVYLPVSQMRVLKFDTNDCKRPDKTKVLGLI